MCSDHVFINNKSKGNPILIKAKMLKSLIRILQTLEKRIFDIAVSEEGDILFNAMVNNDVCILTNTEPL